MNSNIKFGTNYQSIVTVKQTFSNAQSPDLTSQMSLLREAGKGGNDVQDTSGVTEDSMGHTENREPRKAVGRVTEGLDTQEGTGPS